MASLAHRSFRGYPPSQLKSENARSSLGRRPLRTTSRDPQGKLYAGNAPS
jgi:hypothetical protein